MKTPDIRRGIASPHARQGGSAADIGKVARVRSVEMNESRSLRRTRRNDPERHRKILLWSILLGGISVGVIVLTLYMWLAPKISSGAEEISMQASAQKNARIVSKFPSPSSDESLELVKRAMNNRDPVEVEGLLRTGSHSPAEIIAYFAGQEERDGPIKTYQWLSSLDSGILLMEGVLVLSERKGESFPRLALLTPDSSGRWKMDFDAFARTASPSWADLLDQGAEMGQVRVMVRQDTYYNASFTDEKQWLSYALSTPDREEVLHGYCKENSEVAEAMQSLVTAENKASRATLEIRRVAGAESRQFEITKVIARDWLVVAPAQP